MQNSLQAVKDAIHTLSDEPPNRYPLSAAQQALWYLHQQSNIGTAYHTAFAASIHSVVDVTSLQQASQALFERHSSLRSTVTLVANNPCQVVHADRAVDFAQIHCPYTESESTWRQRVQCAYAHPFDLEQGPLFRVRLFTRTATEHLLLISAHHLIIDGVSMRVLLDELALLYPAVLHGLPPQLPALRATYQDFVTWEKEMLHQQEEALWQYWREQLSDVEPLQLPLDRPRPALQSHRGASYYFQVPADLLQKLDALNGVATATLHSKFLTAFQILLYRYSGQSCFTVGVPGANRLRPEFQRLVGYLTNLLPIRTEIAADASFYQLLQETTRRTFAATMRQNMPFSRMVTRLNPQRDLSYLPGTQVTFGFLPSPKGLNGFYVAPPQQTASHLTQWGELQLAPFALPQQEGQFDLSLELEEEADRLLGRLKYNLDLFDEATIARMVNHFVVLLQGIVAQPDQAVLHLPMLTPSEHQQIVHEWNATTVDFGPPQTIHALFEQQVARTPDALAVISPKSAAVNPMHPLTAADSLTYAELNARANQLAHYLRQAGVRPETPVGVCLNRNLDLIIATLAIIKAGGAYVPLDATYPLQRLHFMVQDSGLTMILTQTELIDALPTNARLVDLKEVTLEQYPTCNLAEQTTPEHLLYIMYTSGSAGTPKGIEILHRNVQRLVKGGNFAQLDATQTFLQLASPSFDAATLEIWGSLCNGAKLVLYPDLLIDLNLVGQLIQSYQVTILWLTAGLFHQMVDEHLTGLQGLHQLLAGGDVLSPAHVKRLLQATDAKLTVINGYGPTENTTFTTTYRIADHKAFTHSIPIGRPISNTRVYILNEGRQLTPVGVPGELYTGGLGVARGYLNRPELTDERFINHPELGRLYKTGDLCRWLPDGNIEYIGRTDFQVKLRGFRIELGEIENALRAQAGVREALVLVQEDVPGDKRLVAYIVGDKPTGRHATKTNMGEEVSLSPSQLVTQSELRQALAQQIPDYMIPAAFVFLDAMPLTPNGKLNRRALPKPDYGKTRQSFVPAETSDETRLLVVWHEVLGVQPIGVEDNFFELGGHSLLAAQLVQRMRQTLQREVSLRQVFSTPTIRGLLQSLDDQQTETNSFVKLRMGDTTQTPLFLCYPGSGVIFAYTPLLPYLPSTQPVYALQAQGIYDDLPLFASIEALAAQTINEMKSIQPQGPYSLVGLSFGGIVALEVAYQLKQQGEEVALLGMIDTYPPLNDQATQQEETPLPKALQQFLYVIGDDIHVDYRCLGNEIFERAAKQEEPIGWLLEQMRAQGIPPAMDPAIFKRMWIATKHNQQMMQAYQLKPYNGDITIFCAEESVSGKQAPLGAEEGVQRWQHLTQRPVETVWVRGGHYTMFTPENVESLGRALTTQLEKRKR